MKQVAQSIRTGATTIRQLPDPVSSPGCVTVANVSSLISSGAERYVVELAKMSLLQKARERPDHVRRVLQKLKQEGLVTTAQQVMAKLDEPMPLGYSSAGVVLECGRNVSECMPAWSWRVATSARASPTVSPSTKPATRPLGQSLSREFDWPRSRWGIASW